MTKLSVNINKIATLRNARGGEIPNLVKMAVDIEKFGADGITVHPRPDARHITYQDVYDLSKVVTTEFNIEGYPNEAFISLVKEVKPAQVTLVPDPPGVLTSSEGWNTKEQQSLLKPIISGFKEVGIRVSIFLEPDEDMVEHAKTCGTDRIEFYTGHYAANYHQKEKEVLPYVQACKKAVDSGLGINAGHDLSLENLAFFIKQMPRVDEVSIGHALIADALYYGMEETIKKYKAQVQ